MRAASRPAPLSGDVEATLDPKRSVFVLDREMFPELARRLDHPSDLQKKDSLDRAIVQMVARRHVDEVTACYEALLAKTPDKSGTVTTQFLVAADGQVTRAQVTASTVADAATEDCIGQSLLHLAIPAFASGSRRDVRLPLRLGPAIANGLHLARANAGEVGTGGAARGSGPSPAEPSARRPLPPFGGRGADLLALVKRDADAACPRARVGADRRPRTASTRACARGDSRLCSAVTPSPSTNPSSSARDSQWSAPRPRKRERSAPAGAGRGSGPSPAEPRLRRPLPPFGGRGAITGAGKT